MINPVNNYQQVPGNYSGVTINIANPGLNVGSSGISAGCTPCQYGVMNNQMCQPQYPMPQYNTAPTQPQVAYQQYYSQPIDAYPQQAPVILAQNAPAYPPQYYLNNYNYINENGGSNPQPVSLAQAQIPAEVHPDIQYAQPAEAEDMSKSNNIINDLNAREAEQKAIEKNSVKTEITALTNEYIMSLENYLNNPNSEIRLMASKEILARFDEDKDRYDDAALNALLNKMLQDPEKLIRIAALSALSSGLASGNDFTMKLLDDIQKDPNADKEDVLQASQIMLKRTTETEEILIPQQEPVYSIPQEITYNTPQEPMYSIPQNATYNLPQDAMYSVPQIAEEE